MQILEKRKPRQHQFDWEMLYLLPQQEHQKLVFHKDQDMKLLRIPKMAQKPPTFPFWRQSIKNKRFIS